MQKKKTFSHVTEARRLKSHSIKTKRATTWQNQQSDCVPSENSVQPGHLPSLIRVFAVRSMGSYGPKFCSCGQRSVWSDWADDAQADLSLGWAHTHFVGFVILHFWDSSPNSLGMTDDYWCQLVLVKNVIILASYVNKWIFFYFSFTFLERLPQYFGKILYLSTGHILHVPSSKNKILEASCTSLGILSFSHEVCSLFVLAFLFGINIKPILWIRISFFIILSQAVGFVGQCLSHPKLNIQNSRVHYKVAPLTVKCYFKPRQYPTTQGQTTDMDIRWPDWRLRCT